MQTRIRYLLPGAEKPIYIASRGGADAALNIGAEFEERQVPHSTALHSLRKKTGECYLVGPLARVGLSHDRLSPTARQLADEVGIAWPSTNPFHSIVARGLELVHVFEEALEILRDP
ncbi:MAG: hypothetical protein OQK01_14515, partial [Xanthomonadales bacterium]|nr:hypothetical protein [Xanthomonadales bacterium]